MFVALLKTDQVLMPGKLAGGSPLSGLEKAESTTFDLYFSQLTNIK
jgi:hypothetical protein